MEIRTNHGPQGGNGMGTHKGIMHVHSTFSYDGQHSLAEIAELGRRRGYSFICMTEHSDTLNADLMNEHVKECSRLSGSDLVIIPGIEFSCENDLHMLAVGMRRYTDCKDPIEVAKFIRAHDGIAVVAHPSRYDYDIPRGLAWSIHGIEAWNAGYDGRFVPNDRSLNLLEELRSRNKGLVAYGGQDFHWMTPAHHVQIVISCETLTEAMILTALRRGRFMISGPFFEFNAAEKQSRVRMAQIRVARAIYSCVKGIRDQIKRS